MVLMKNPRMKVQNKETLHGVSAIIGAGCSQASVLVAQVAGNSHVPVVSPSSTSPTLSNGKAYPYFLRVVASDAITTEVMVGVLVKLWNYTRVAVVHSTDAYGAGGATGFAQAAFAQGLTVTTSISFNEASTDFKTAIARLCQTGSRVIVLFGQGSDASRLMHDALVRKYDRNKTAAAMQSYYNRSLPRNAPGPKSAAYYSYRYNLPAGAGDHSGTTGQMALLRHVRRN